MKNWRGSYRWITKRILRGGFIISEGKENKVYKQLTKIIEEMKKVSTDTKSFNRCLRDLIQWKKVMESKF